jgi:hypothetical protein
MQGVQRSYSSSQKRLVAVLCHATHSGGPHSEHKAVSPGEGDIGGVAADVDEVQGLAHTWNS